MSKLVVILGAGASADFGVPTLGQLFKDTHARAFLKGNTWLAERLHEMFWSPRGHDLNTSDLSLTVEEMLTILRDWEKEGTVPKKLTSEELALFRKEIYVLIYKALFEGKSSRKEHLNTLIEFARQNFEHTTWASFNWDCIFESSFWYSSGTAQPGTRTNPSLAVGLEGWWGGSSRHLYLKLHGSINWWYEAGKLKYLKFSGNGELRSKWQTYALDPKPSAHPVILEPSYYKYDDSHYMQLKPQWDVFLQKLVEADFVLIVGYSLPTADGQARSKLLTAFQANEKAFWGVIDPGTEAVERYRRLLGTKRLEVFNSTLGAFNNDFLSNFKEMFSTFAPKSGRPAGIA